jgi:hypothetical protein
MPSNKFAIIIQTYREFFNNTQTTEHISLKLSYIVRRGTEELDGTVLVDNGAESVAINDDGAGDGVESVSVNSGGGGGGAAGDIESV